MILCCVQFYRTKKRQVVGTTPTRPVIIERLIELGFVERNKKTVTIIDIGIAYIKAIDIKARVAHISRLPLLFFCVNQQKKRNS